MFSYDDISVKGNVLIMFVQVFFVSACVLSVLYFIVYYMAFSLFIAHARLVFID